MVTMYTTSFNIEKTQHFPHTHVGLFLMFLK